MPVIFRASTALAPALLALTMSASPAPAQSEDADAASPAMETGESADAGGEETAPGETLSAETVIAEIDGVSVTLGELIAVRRTLPQRYQELPGEVLLEGLTRQLVNQHLLAEGARAAGLDERADIRLNLRNMRTSALADAYMRERIEERVTEAAVEAAYEERYVEGEAEVEIRASHILVEEKAAAEKLKAELEEGAEFAELAREHGTDGTAQNGGDLGWFVEGDMVPEFSDAAFALEEVGTLSAPVESPFGWHLIKLTGKRDREAPPLEEVRGQIEQELTQAAQSEIVEEARAGAEVETRIGELPAEAVFADELILPDAGE